jgi:hypothetical protein
MRDARKWCLYYKGLVALALARAINYAPRVIFQIVTSPTIIIYNRNIVI